MARRAYWPTGSPMRSSVATRFLCWHSRAPSRPWAALPSHGSNIASSILQSLYRQTRKPRRSECRASRGRQRDGLARGSRPISIHARSVRRQGSCCVGSPSFGSDEVLGTARLRGPASTRCKVTRSSSVASAPDGSRRLHGRLGMPLRRWRDLPRRSPSPSSGRTRHGLSSAFDADVISLNYSEITSDGMVRHPSLKGLIVRD